MTDLEKTIRAWVEIGNLPAVIGLAESLKSARDRAERKVEIYLHELGLLTKKFETLNAPVVATTAKLDKTRTRAAAQRGPKPTKSGTAVDIDLEL